MKDLAFILQNFPIKLITSHICKATSRVCTSMRACNALLFDDITCSKQITENTHVLPVPDLA